MTQTGVLLLSRRDVYFVRRLCDHNTDLIDISAQQSVCLKVTLSYSIYEPHEIDAS